ncbi:hypothetical protein M8J77_005799 [Diaphorina citri]|nr:hypothetical protein M8J77_005799 [Diaphorina citri]
MFPGLDPAGPLFESQDPRSRLDSSDAQFVDVIHSNGENLILGGLGSWQPLGHVDFYPNGGRMQKGCTNLFVGAVSDILWSATEVYGRSLCNHRRAYKFFTDSVLPRCNFPALACESYEKYLEGNCFNCTDPTKCGNMGYYADKSTGRGTLYLLTRDEEPFCAHQYLVKVQSSTSKLPVVSYGKIQITLIGDLQLNETFTITQKDDEELKVGGMISRIIVPHPALQVFTSVQIQYTSYSGWISSGLARWSVDKILLTDTSGSSLSICKKDLVLETGVPQLLPLFPGDCKVSESSSTDVINETLVLQNLLLSSNKSKPPFVTEVVKIGDEIIPKKNKTSSGNSIDISLSVDPELNGIGVGVTDYFKSPWDPVVDLSNNGNSLDSTDKDNIENSGRGFLSLENESPSPNVSRSFRESGSKNWNVNHDSKNTSDKSEIQEDHKGAPIETPLPTMAMDAGDSATYVPDISITMNYSSLEQYWSTSVKPVTENKSGPYEFVTDKPTPTSVTTTLKEIVKANTTTPQPEIKEPVLKPKTARSRSISRVNKKLLDENRWTPREDLNPPAMGATESWKHWEENSSKSPRNIHNISSKSDVQTSSEKPKSLSFTVQFLPQKLLQFLEQAEKYAKLAFSPFMSDEKSSDSRSQRRLKYLPQFLFGKETSQKSLNESKKQETDSKGNGSDKSKVLLPYSTNVESSFQPHFIPLTEGKQKDSDLTDEPVVRISRPEAHMDTPMVNNNNNNS